ncbi:MAG: hypothetical protein MUF06_12905 [Pirellulaceae bacterium]|jgi:hypothetical protein|nr:hypothetical protein [Pirellulaceae bacterium]
MPAGKDAGPIDEDSKTHLEQAKKGKLRRFVLLCKGQKIVSLVVFKKGSIDKYKKQAKESGAGQISFGVAEGQGADITFRLARADGFEVEPTRPTLLKEFLAEHAQIKCKPAFEIVDSHGPLLDPADPLHARFLKAQAAVPAAAEANPERAAELRTLAGATAQLLDQDLPNQAEAKLVTLEALLGGLAGHAASVEPTTPSAAATPPAAPPPPPQADVAPTTPAPGSNKALSGEFVQRFSKLKPQLDQALALSLPVSARVKEQGGIVAALARKNDFAAALSELAPLEKLVAEALNSQSAAQPAPPPPPPPPPAPPVEPGISQELKQLTDAATDLGPRVIAAVKSHPELRDEILRPIGAFQKHVAAGKVEQARQALQETLLVLQRMEGSAGPLSPSAPAMTTTEDSLVTLQKARLEWDSTRKAVQNELRTLEQAILAICRDEPDFAAIKDGTKNLYVMLETLDTRLSDKLDEALNADTPDQRAARRREALTIADEYLDFVIDDDLINHIDDNGFVRVGVRLRMLTTLNDLLARLSA